MRFEVCSERVITQIIILNLLLHAFTLKASTGSRPALKLRRFPASRNVPAGDRFLASIVLSSLMSGSASPPPPAEAAGADPFLPGYTLFRPEDHGLDRGFRLTGFSDLKG